jgi:octanoyl-[GcvH]:protein N-octanoyltransferase
VRDVIVAVSAALGYPLREASIAGLADFAPALNTERVAGALADDYRDRLGLTDAELPSGLLETADPSDAPGTEGPFDVDAWSRANPVSQA